MEEEIKRLVKKLGNGAHVTIPKAWLGKFVEVKLLR